VHFEKHALPSIFKPSCSATIPASRLHQSPDPSRHGCSTAFVEWDGVKMNSTDEHPKKTRRHWIISLSVICLVALVLVFVLRKSKSREQAGKAKPAPAIPIATDVAKKGNIGVYIEALGTVTPVYTVSVIARVQGQVTAVNYQEGQIVKKNDSLVEIDPRPYEAAVLQAEGALARDEADLHAARVDLIRYRKAAAKKAIPQQQLDDQEQTVLQDMGTVKADQGALDSARLNLAYCHITSPIEGRVGLRLVDPGNMVQANSTTPLVVITQLHPITVIFSVAEDYISQIQAQLKQGGEMAVDVFDRAQEKKIATGTFLTLDNQVDQTTGTVKIRAVFKNEDDALFPNQFVNARLLVTTQKDATLLSSSTIQRGPQGSFVYVVKDDKTVEMRAIKAGTTDGKETAVTGVEPNETVVATGFEKLQNGSKVAVKDADSDSHQMAGTAKPSPNPSPSEVKKP
jgi:multidrug efflux system membrane fusion protein